MPEPVRISISSATVVNWATSPLRLTVRATQSLRSRGGPARHLDQETVRSARSRARPWPGRTFGDRSTLLGSLGRGVAVARAR